MGTKGGWAFKNGPSPAHLQHLAEQMKACVNADLHAKLFARDFRKQREALAELSTVIQTYKVLIRDASFHFTAALANPATIIVGGDGPKRGRSIEILYSANV